MKIAIIYYLLIYICVVSGLWAQPQCHIVHYSLKDGLPQRSIMDIMQDKKGFIWLATWDGLCKFDGYNFTNYKSSTEDSIFIKNNRVDKIYEDAHGYIWTYTYNKETFRFDPVSEKFITSFKVNGKPFYTTTITPMPSGKVWLTSNKDGVICTPNTDNNYLHFGNTDKTLPNEKINLIFEDSHRYSWILTNDGLLRISPDLTQRENFSAFFSSWQKNGEKIPVFTAFESNNEIWFGSDRGRILCYNRDDNKFKFYETGVESHIISIKKIYNNTYILLTSNDGFIICDQNKTKIKEVNTAAYKNLPTNEMLSSFIDRNNNIWIETNTKGVVKFNLEKNILKYYKPNDYGNNNKFYPSFFIIEDKSGRIWIHPHGGLSYYDEKNDKLQSFYNDPNSIEWKFSDILHNAFIDNQGNIWLSTRTGGLEKIVFDNTMFKLNDFYSNKITTTGYEIRSIFEDNNRNIWIGNKKGQISVYDENKNFKGFLCKDGSISKSGTLLNAIAVYTFCQTSDGNIWIGTKGLGIFALIPSTIDKNKFSIKHYKYKPDDKYSLSDDAVYSIHEDKNGQVWVGTYGGGLNKFDKQNERFISYRNELKYPMEIGSQVRSIVSRQNMLYVGTTSGLIVFPLNSEKNYKLYSKTYKSKNGLRANDIYNLYITKDNSLFGATFGGGIYKVESYDNQRFPINFKTYDVSNGLGSDIILSVIEDANGQLWLNSEGNLFRFDRKTEEFESFNDVSQIISDQYFTEAKPLLTSQGELIYGCAHGSLSFVPDKIMRNEFIPYLALTQFKVLNNILPLKNKIDDIGNIDLSHNENTFSIEFAALDYRNPQSISYSYKLDGFDEKWINGQQRTATYTNIPPGKYLFRVKSTNSNGTWTENERHLNITVKPSFLETFWAYLIYMVLLFLILYTILRSIFIFYRMKDRVLLEQEQTEMKTRFFTDISHEIRTPLTMIVSPLENIISDENTSDNLKPQLQLIQRNANRMLKMVNQILDFRKIQQQKLHVRETVIGNYIHDLCVVFQKNIEYNELEFTFDNAVGNEKLWVDTDSIEKLIYNLISNSIKHTSKGEKIEVRIFSKDEDIAIQVKDSGEGITKEVLSKLFTRFASFNIDKSKPSTGIGLSIVKEVADKHHARIVVDSDISKGSCFTVLFQTGTEHFKGDHNVDIIVDETDSDELVDSTHLPLTESDEKESEHPLSVLVVEDDSELRGFIKSVLASHYVVYEAQNGQEGYNCSIKHNPDFILSDIMMPEMDGMAFLRAIRQNHNTSHIPFILLTAKTSIDDKLEGTISGADDYITKPFSIKLLIAKIENIIRQRKRLTDYLSSHKNEYRTREEESAIRNRITEQDELFLKNLRHEIDNNIDNSDFIIDDLVAKTNLSRRVFFNKVKGLTGLAPVEFIREIRLKHAAQLLKDPQYRIKEVIYMVGFSDIRYFTQCFKKMYGMPPSQYRDQLKSE